MATICGVINKNNNKDIINNMILSMKEFGKKSDYYFDDNKSFSILDNDGKSIYENKDYIIVLDGNVDIKKVSSLYKKYKYNMVNKINGFFLLSIYDKKNQELFIARDPWGSKSLYYYLDKNSFVYSSDIKPILNSSLYEKVFNENILASYLCFNSVGTNETFFKGIFKLSAGNYIIYKKNKVKIKNYFDFRFKNSNDSMEKTVDNIEKAVKLSVKNNSKKLSNLGSFLSSGVDSSYLVALLRPKHTFTIGYKNKNYNEVNYAKDLADKLGIINHARIIDKDEYINELPKVVKNLSEPLANPSLVPIYLLTKEASNYCDSIFSGEGADELFGGYNSYQEEITQQWYMKIPFCVRHLASTIAGFFPDIRGLNFIYRRGKNLNEYNIGLGRVFRDKEALSLLNNKNQVMPMDVVKPYYDKYNKCSTLEQRQIIDYYFWLVNDFAYCVDKCSLLNNMNGSTPYLCQEVFDVAMTLPLEYKVNHETTKIAFRKAAARSIPNDSYMKKKLGFPVPLRDWIKEDDYYQKIKEAFISSTASKFFDVSKLLRLLDKNKSGKVAEYKKIWTIYVFIIWYDLNFKED